MKKIVLGGGCFWCTETIYRNIEGVNEVVSGYAGGSTNAPNYWDHADHAEVIEVTYDEDQISLETLLDVFFHVHDPTTLNRQGVDVGTSYRSIALYNTDDEREVIEGAIKTAQSDWDDPIVTEVKKLDEFTEAEPEHQDFYNQQNGRNPYCQIVIDPKMAKFRQRFAKIAKND